MEQSVNVAALNRLNDVAAGCANGLTSLVASLECFGRRLYEMAWHSYILAGAPYGETIQGFKRWLRERW